CYVLSKRPPNRLTTATALETSQGSDCGHTYRRSEEAGRSSLSGYQVESRSLWTKLSSQARKPRKPPRLNRYRLHQSSQRCFAPRQRSATSSFHPAVLHK